MKRMPVHRCIVHLIVLTGMLLSCHTENLPSKKKITAVQGVIDLKDWDFEKDGIIVIDGEWEFYWNRLHKPKDFRNAHPPAMTGFMKLPSVWNGYIVEGKPLEGNGYATFRVCIKLHNPPPVLACLAGQQETASRTWIDGTTMLSSGTVGTSRDTMVPKYTSPTGTFRPSGDTIEIIIQISNFFHRKGGFRQSLSVGTETQIREMRDRIRALDLFLFGSLMIIAFYHFGLFWMRKSDRSPLYFGLVCLCIGLRLLFDGSYILELLPGIGWGVAYKVYYVCGYLSLPMFATFIRTLYPLEFSKYVFRIIIGAAAILTAILVVTPARIYTLTWPAYALTTLLSGLYMIFVLILAAKRRRDGAGIFLGGLFVLFISFILYVLKDVGILDIIDTLSFGFFVFIFAQSMSLSMHFSRTFVLAETQAGELREIRNRLSNVINSMPSVIIGLDTGGRVTNLNTEAARIAGVSEEAAKKRPLEEVFSDLDRLIIDAVRNFSGSSPVILEKLIKAKGNDVQFFNAVLYPLFTEKLDGVVLRIDDITEFEKKEAQLRQAQKMETVGTLAAGLAHDFNNVLSGVFGPISILKYKLEKYTSIGKGQFSEYLDLIENSALRAKDMVQQLLALSRKHELNLATVDCNTIIDNIVKICNNSFDKSIHITVNYARSRPVIVADAAQIEQVVINMCVNASHAMIIMRKEHEKRGGVLTVSVDTVDADRYFCNIHPEAENIRYRIISVGDTGVGMDATAVSKIFTPFYTTKAKDQGTGLGLSMAYNIIKQHRGFIDVYSEPGVGSTFNIYLPAASEDTKVQDTASPGDMEVTHGEGTILLVDDEDIIRITGRGILEECGYTVVLATCGQEALDYFSNNHGKISAVVLDMVMPDISGREVFLAMKQIDPDVKILLSSGFRQDERVEEVLGQGVRGFIQKPYTIMNLAKAIYTTIHS